MTASPLQALALHGGSGTLLRQDMSPELEYAYREALGSALSLGWGILAANGSALEAVQAVVEALEDCPLFNAGRGSVFTAEGKHEMDAAIMNGADRRAGAVAGIRLVRNPIQLARRVLERGEFVLLSGTGAEAFAREEGIAFAPESYFFTELRHRQWLEARALERVVMDHDLPGKKFGTVGAVACDARGHIAAATSTGGLTGKRFGRIGDSPLIGSGTYANDATCAVSCTGYGEEFIRGQAAYDVAARMEYLGESVATASRVVVHERLPRLNARGGLIAVDCRGNVSLPFNTEGMYRAWQRTGEVAKVQIYRDECTTESALPH
ncbi:MAG: isoaspartyl peptidase/L-asparaginase [Verrucomicrobiota bacterium]|nr:isoaspartyl peptidase/L-asparaginase [Verrucomicrobiota bacterium]